MLAYTSIYFLKKQNIDAYYSQEVRRFALQEIGMYMENKDGCDTSRSFLDIAQELFEVADTDGNGIIEMEQFIEFLISFGSVLGVSSFGEDTLNSGPLSNEALQVAHAQGIYADIDGDRNGMIDESEFLPWILMSLHRLVQVGKTKAVEHLIACLELTCNHRSSVAMATGTESASITGPNTRGGTSKDFQCTGQDSDNSTSNVANSGIQSKYNDEQEIESAVSVADIEKVLQYFSSMQKNCTQALSQLHDRMNALCDTLPDIVEAADIGEHNL